MTDQNRRGCIIKDCTAINTVTLTEQELAAREAAAATAMREACLAAIAEERLTDQPDNDSDAAYNVALGHAADAIRALPLPAPPKEMSHD